MLPKLVTPKYDMIEPSTGETVTYRPYVVREEKILLIAIESRSEIAVEKAVADIIKACIESPIDIKKLTTFDIEFIFITLRSKSVGEGVKLNPTCEHCEERSDHKIDLEAIKILLEYGASVNAKDNLNFSALDYAIKSNNLPATMLLVHNGATITGNSYMYAVNSNYREIIGFFDTLDPNKHVFLRNKNKR